MLVRAILPNWAVQEYPERLKIIEGEFSDDELLDLNDQFYNIHNLPNYPSQYQGGTVDGSQIDTFEYAYVDMDLKDGVYKTKDEFIEVLTAQDPIPTRIIDSGNGVHAYWRVSDLDALSFLKFQRRLIRRYKTDEAVAKIYQLMRPAGFINTKHKDNFKPVECLYEDDTVYTSEQLDALLPPITHEDALYCKTHHDMTYRLSEPTKVDDALPIKFYDLIRSSQEAKDIWAGSVEDRSKSDYRLGHLMFAHGFTKAEALSVLVNSSKALARAPVHRVSYAEGIVSKIWTFELEEKKDALDLSYSVKDILQKSGDSLKGTRFPCWRYLDATAHGFRLGQVIGLVAGVGVGKTAMALNMFEGFVQNNPDYVHFFVPLEQPANEIADRWRTMCGTNTALHDKVHVLSNYTDEGQFRHLSLDEIREYILKFQNVTGKKVGCVVIDHIGVLKKKGKDGENQDLMTICHQMKAFAVETGTLLVMQSQTSREKAGEGDLELNKDAAYGTQYFEAYCDYLVTIWQPLKRCYSDPACPKVTAFKFCKIRHKKLGRDEMVEGVPYLLKFDPETERMTEITQVDQDQSFAFFNNQAINARKRDRKSDVVPYKSVSWTDKGVTKDGKINNHQNLGGAKRPTHLS